MTSRNQIGAAKLGRALDSADAERWVRGTLLGIIEEVQMNMFPSARILALAPHLLKGHAAEDFATDPVGISIAIDLRQVGGKIEIPFQMTLHDAVNLGRLRDRVIRRKANDHVRTSGLRSLVIAVNQIVFRSPEHGHAKL